MIASIGYPMYMYHILFKAKCYAGDSAAEASANPTTNNDKNKQATTTKSKTMQTKHTVRSLASPLKAFATQAVLPNRS